MGDSPIHYSAPVTPGFAFVVILGDRGSFTCAKLCHCKVTTSPRRACFTPTMVQHDTCLPSGRSSKSLGSPEGTHSKSWQLAATGFAGAWVRPRTIEFPAFFPVTVSHESTAMVPFSLPTGDFDCACPRLIRAARWFAWELGRGPQHGLQAWEELRSHRGC